MKERCFIGTCNWKQLVGFSLGVIRHFLPGGVPGGSPKNTIAVSINNNRNCYFAFAAEDMIIQPDHVRIAKGVNIGFYRDDRIFKAFWISNKQNELTAYRKEKNKNKDEFFLILVERTKGISYYRKLLAFGKKDVKVKLTRVHFTPKN